jgi:tetratricopeptide (TPR) repeat protein
VKQRVAALALALAVMSAASVSWRADAADSPLVVRIDPAWLELPIGRRDGIGRAHRTASTPSAEAQDFYDQGLALLHSYEWIDAARSFHEALRADPQLALAQVGLAQAYLQLDMPTQAKEHLDLAAQLAAARSTTDAERAVIAAAKLQLEAVRTPANERPAKLDAYRQALDGMIANDPTDVESILLRGLAEEPSGWGRGQHGGESTLKFYGAALEKDPNHPGANHYLAHTLENLGRYPEAAVRAQRFGEIASSVPHAQHMVGHSLPRLGRWDEALMRFESSNGLGHAHGPAAAIPTGADWHHLHNLVLLGLVYDELGRPADAKKTLAEAFATGNPSSSMQTSWALYPEYLLTVGDPTAALQAATELRQRSPGLLEVIGIALEGEALLDQGDLAGAKAKAEEGRRRATELERALASDPMNAPQAGLAAEQLAILDGRLAIREDTATPEQVRTAAQALSSRKTFDAWGRQDLRLKRLAKDMLAADDAKLAAEIEAQRIALRGPGPVTATPPGDVSSGAAAAASPAAAGSAAAPAATAAPPPAPTAAAHDWNDAGIAWRPYDEGLKEAATAKKPVLLVFYTEWCPHCRNYQRVFHDPRVVAGAKDFVMIRIDRDRTPEVSTRYTPDGEYIPRTYFLSSDGVLEPTIHAPREQYLYFYDEHDPTPLLAAMDAARTKLGAPAAVK